MPDVRPGRILPAKNTAFDALLMLKDQADAAISATTAETGIEFRAYAQLGYKALINFNAYTGYAAGTAEWQIAIEASADNVAWTEIGRTSLNPDGQLQTEVAISGPNVAALVENAAYVRANAILVGAAGNLQYGASLTNLK